MVEAEVRGLVRCRGLDPIEDRAAVRRLVDLDQTARRLLGGTACT
jgi:hypothetical protein